MGRVRIKNSPVPIAFIAGQLGLGGAEQQLYYLLTGLDRSRFRPTVVSLGPAPEEYWTGRIRELDVLVRHISNCRGRIGRVFQIANFLRSERVRIAHGWVLHTNPYSALAGRLAGVPLRLGSMRGNYQGLPMDKFVRWTSCRGLDVLVTNSKAAGREIQEFRLTATRIRVVPNGIQPSGAVTDAQRNRLKVELGFGSENQIIGTIGRIDRNKNHMMLLRVFVGLARKWPELRLIIIGDGPLKPQLVAEARRLGVTEKVSLPGEVPLAARYLPALEVCCLTSYTEGLPNIIMEACAAGLPVISTTCGGTLELIDEGITGYRIPPDDDVSMTTELDRLLTTPEQRRLMGQKGRCKMHSEFSVGNMIDRMTQVYEEAIEAKGLE